MPRLHDAPGSALQLLVVSTGEKHCAGIDLASGALVRAWSAAPVDQRLRPYDVVEVTVAREPDLVADPSEPEAVVVSGPPKLAGRMTGRTARRLIRPLLHPQNTPLLGFHGPAIPFWERKPDHPSVALAEPQSGVVITLHEASLWCHFLWGGRPQVIGCVDPRLAGSLERIRSSHARMKPGGVLVVALSPPADGHCYKVVEAVVPRR